MCQVFIYGSVCHVYYKIVNAIVFCDVPEREKQGERFFSKLKMPDIADAWTGLLATGGFSSERIWVFLTVERWPRGGTFRGLEF